MKFKATATIKWEANNTRCTVVIAGKRVELMGGYWKFNPKQGAPEFRAALFVAGQSVSGAKDYKVFYDLAACRTWIESELVTQLHLVPA